MKREVVLDTETTGLDPVSGHRIVEIGCVELRGGIRTGEVFHVYLNPGREVPQEATRVHGLTNAFLKDKPMFAEKVEAFLEFLGDSRLVIHNAPFDMKFVNYELGQCGFPVIPMERVTDTLAMARAKYPGSPASLDALCKKFAIDLSGRTKHGALLDSELLAEVYLEMMGGRQVGLVLETAKQMAVRTQTNEARVQRVARAFAVSKEELAAHAAMVAKLKNAVWAA